MRILGIIPARGGSKRLHRKNIALLAGKPLMQYAIEAARESRLDNIVVSTEDPEIAAMARHLGAFVVDRPKELAEDNVFTIEVVKHAVKYMQAQGYQWDYAMTLQADQPLRTSEEIDGGLAVLREHPDADGVYSVLPRHQFNIEIDKATGLIEWTEDAATKRADQYVAAGCFEIYKLPITDGWWKGKIYPYVVPQSSIFDINTPWDLSLAEMVLLRRRADASALRAQELSDEGLHMKAYGL